MIGLYLRVSTGQQVDNTSLDAQEELCRTRVRELGLNNELIKVYREEGLTGEDIIRPKMNELRDDVADGVLSHVVCTSPDRFSRDLTDKLIVCRELDKSGVKLVFVDTEYSNSPEGQLFFNMQSVIAQYELALIKKRTTRGRLKAVEKFKKVMPMRTPPYGYDLIDGTLIINQEEAGFVKQIYDWYVYGNYTMRDIGEKLYTLGATPKRGESKNWSASSIRRILTSEIYIGKYYYNRRKSMKVRGEKTVSGNTKRTYEYRDPSEWLTIEVPAIVDSGLFNLAQQQKVRNMKVLSGNTKYEYLLKSLLKCNCCGRAWDSTTYSGSKSDKKYLVYRCSGKIPRKYGEGVEKCATSVSSIRADVLDEYVWKKIIEVILNPDNFIQSFKNDGKKSLETIEKTVLALEKQLQQQERAKEKVKKMYISELISDEEMTKDMNKINNTVKELHIEIEKHRQQMNHLDTKNLTFERIKDLFLTVKKTINEEPDKLTFQKKRQIVEMLVDEIIVETEGDDVTLTYVGLLHDMKRDLAGRKAKSENIVSCSQHQEV